MGQTIIKVYTWSEFRLSLNQAPLILWREADSILPVRGLTVYLPPSGQLFVREVISGINSYLKVFLLPHYPFSCTSMTACAMMLQNGSDSRLVKQFSFICEACLTLKISLMCTPVRVAPCTGRNPVSLLKVSLHVIPASGISIGLCTNPALADPYVPSPAFVIISCDYIGHLRTSEFKREIVKGSKSIWSSVFLRSQETEASIPFKSSICYMQHYLKKRQQRDGLSRTRIHITIVHFGFCKHGNYCLVPIILQGRCLLRSLSFFDW